MIQMSEQFRLTTIDNPFDPFTQFTEWYTWDESHGHGTSELLDRVAETSYSFDDELNNAVRELAMDSLIDLFPGLYRKISENEVYFGVQTA